MSSFSDSNNFNKAVKLNKRNSLKEAQQQFKLKTTSSFKSIEQFKGTCYAISCTRLIVKFITKFLKDDFTLSENDIKLLYTNKSLVSDDENYIENKNDENIQNCFFNKEEMTESTKETLISKCIVKPRYNYAILFYFVLEHIKRVFGTDGEFSIRVIIMFKYDKNKLFQLNEEINADNCIITKEIDLEVREFINKYYDYIESNKINIIINRQKIYPNTQTEANNWINNFPKGAQEAIKDDLYIILEFELPSKIMNEFQLNPYSTNKINLTPKDIELTNLSAHAVVITEWDGKSVTILNSWRKSWGTNGYFILPSKYYYKLVDMSDISDKDEDKGLKNWFKQLFKPKKPDKNVNTIEFIYLSYNNKKEPDVTAPKKKLFGFKFGGKTRKQIRNKTKHI